MKYHSLTASRPQGVHYVRIFSYNATRITDRGTVRWVYQLSDIGCLLKHRHFQLISQWETTNRKFYSLSVPKASFV